MNEASCERCGGTFHYHYRTKLRRICDRCVRQNAEHCRREYRRRIALGGEARGQSMDGLLALALRTQTETGRILGLDENTVQVWERKAILSIRARVREWQNGAVLLTVAEPPVEFTLAEMLAGLREWRALLEEMARHPVDPEDLEEWSALVAELRSSIEQFAATLNTSTNGGAG